MVWIVLTIILVSVIYYVQKKYPDNDENGNKMNN